MKNEEKQTKTCVCEPDMCIMSGVDMIILVGKMTIIKMNVAKALLTAINNMYPFHIRVKRVTPAGVTILFEQQISKICSASKIDAHIMSMKHFLKVVSNITENLASFENMCKDLENAK